VEQNGRGTKGSCTSRAEQLGQGELNDTIRSERAEKRQEKDRIG
jgi:hypothetical protein